jgi:two-component system sensor histidine kinase UhpB
MSLRTRVLMLMGVVLAAGVLVGSAFSGLQARNALRAELKAGLDGGISTIRSAFEDLPRSDHQERDLLKLVATFDGNRHVRAVLIGADGRIIAASQAARPQHAAPGWFAKRLGQEPPIETLTVPGQGAGAIRLVPTAGLDESVLWDEFCVAVGVLVLTAAAGLGLVYLAIGAALRPLLTLSESFARIGAGDYAGRVSVEGPSEVSSLAQGFNAMAAELAAMDARNRQLESQLVTLQEEERADLARDLHDEIGPHLFAVNVDAQVIGQLAHESRLAEVHERIGSIQAGVGHMQRLVREILGRLRPTRATELGLAAALEDLAAFWRARRPEVAIELVLPEDEGRLDEPLKDAVYRIVQEAVSNAVRHADPRRVRVEVSIGDGGQVLVEVSDDGTKRAVSVTPGAGLGLVGMRERVRASGGTLRIDRGGGRDGGWTVRASLPLAATRELEAAEAAGE